MTACLPRWIVCFVLVLLVLVAAGRADEAAAI